MYEDSKGSFFGILKWTPNKFRYCAINFSFRRIYLVKPQNSCIKILRKDHFWDLEPQNSCMKILRKDHSLGS
ncbi:hypothetical protein Avbf_17175 [Armadillidium vulgare]|nr:hypothetical protein Avbf_17175 [Armadillidium vulgare]